MSPSGKVCPVCDTQVADGVKKCPSCGTDLTLFEVELDLASDHLTSFANAVIGEEKKSLDEIISSITSSDPAKSAPAPEAVSEKFACPSCGVMLAIDATQCHACGVEFTEDVVEQFECPVCNSIVEGAANKCPSCGAEFATEEEAPAEVAPAQPAAKPEAAPATKPQTPETAKPTAPVQPAPQPAVVEEPAPKSISMPPAASAQKTPAPSPPAAQPVAEEAEVEELQDEEPPAELSFMERMRLIREKRMKEEAEMKAGGPTKATADKPSPFASAAKQSSPAPTVPRIKETPAQQAAQKPAATPQAAVPRIKVPGAQPSTQPAAQPQKAQPVPAQPAVQQKPQAMPGPAAAAPSQPSQTMAAAGQRPSLSDLVKEMKPLLQVARDLDVDIAKERAAIDQAIKAAKSKDQDSAVGLLVDAKASVERALLARLSAKLDQLQAEAAQAKTSGLDVTHVEAAIRDARAKVQGGNALAAKAATDTVAQGLTGNVKETLDANEAVKSATELAVRAKGFGLNVGEAEQTLKLAQGFLMTGDLHKGAAYAKRAREMLSNAIPDMVKEEMRKAKADLLSAKMLGKDIARPMAIMKNASLALKSEDYDEALRSITQFKEAMKML